MREKNSRGFTPILILLILVLVGIGGYLFYKNAQSKIIIDYAPATPSPSPAESSVVITSPTSGSTVTSPLRIEGTVPAGWMFEGVLPIKLLDENRKMIAQGRGQEIIPGSWQSGKPVAFEGKIIFTTTAKSGFLVIEKDNPSDLPENSGSFEIPVVFQNKKITKEQAEEIVSNLAEIKQLRAKYPKYLVEAEGQDGKVWTVHVFQFVDNHTATYGWYEVDIVTGEPTETL